MSAVLVPDGVTRWHPIRLGRAFEGFPGGWIGSPQTKVWANNVEFYERERAACDTWSGGVCTSAPHNNLGLELMRRGDCKAAIPVLEEGLLLPAVANGGSEEVRRRTNAFVRSLVCLPPLSTGGSTRVSEIQSPT